MPGWLQIRLRQNGICPVEKYTSYLFQRGQENVCRCANTLYCVVEYRNPLWVFMSVYISACLLHVCVLCVSCLSVFLLFSIFLSLCQYVCLRVPHLPASTCIMSVIDCLILRLTVCLCPYQFGLMNAYMKDRINTSKYGERTSVCLFMCHSVHWTSVHSYACWISPLYLSANVSLVYICMSGCLPLSLCICLCAHLQYACLLYVR